MPPGDGGGASGAHVNDQAIEQQIAAKGLTAPRVTLAELNANIADTEIVKHVSKTGQVLRWAILTTQNGFAVVGKPSVSVSPQNDNAEIGERVAIDNSRNELWPLMGYALKEQMARAVFLDLVESMPVAEVVTFDQFVQYGRDHGGNSVNDMPWSFNFRGHPVTHENDRCYLIMGKPGQDLRLTPNDVLVINPDGSLTTVRAEPVEV
jgi:hypothetical protein